LNTDEPRIPVEAVARSLDVEVDRLSFLGRGGQGDAWRLRADGDDRVVKVIVGALDAERVRREIAALTSVSDPHVMAFHSTATVQYEDADYLAILGEYIPGGTVAERLAAGRWPDERQALRCGCGALKGIAALHDADRIHRDVKPGNLGVRSNDWDGETVVLDLGLVRDLGESSLTVYPNLLGTVPFMAPEQLRLERAVKRSDVFALGVTLFLLITHRHPYFVTDTEQVTHSELLARMESQHWPDWEAVADSLAGDVAELLTTMLALEPYDRPRARRAFAVVEELLEGRP
jgi:serine/threonine protein kinase